MFSRRYIPAQVFLILLSGVIVYWMCRPGMLLFRWFRINQPAKTDLSDLGKIINNYYGDIVWVTALCLVTLYIVEKRSAGIISILFLFALPFFSEFAQQMALIPGVFDWIDLLIYFVIVLLFILRFHQKLFIWKN